MNNIALKLAEYLRAYLPNSMIFVDYNPDRIEKDNFDVSIRSQESVIEWYMKIANISWGSGKIVATFFPGVPQNVLNVVIHAIDTFDPNK